ncbi:MAG: VapC toxin family PIN domain ribonuclease, partial [Sphingomonadales bacterium]
MIEPAFLLDANICIYVLQDAEGRATRMVTSQEAGKVVTSSIAYAEVMR